MRGDFSRDSFDPLHGFTRVLQQQGRVELDADGNEREAIQLRLLRKLAADLIGPFGGPQGAFLLSANTDLTFDFAIAPGSYYVDGWLIENPAVSHLRGDGQKHPSQPVPVTDQPAAGEYLAYLEVWERHLAALEHDGPLRRNDPRRLAEIALGGIDTASRGETVWAVRLATAPRAANGAVSWDQVRAGLVPTNRGMLAARAVDPAATESADPCLVAPTAAYRGVENQLYRVEIHTSGTAAEGASFVWSRENGSVLFAVEDIDGKRVRLAEGWRDSRFCLSVGDFVSLEGPGQRRGDAAALFRITQYDDEAIELNLDTAPTLDAAGKDIVLRRWDHRQRPESAGAGKITGGALGVVEGSWINLEDGISVRFEAGSENEPATYRAGDYWLIPARTAIGDVLWPGEDDGPTSLPPHGVERHLAPLGVVSFDGQGAFKLETDLRKEFKPLTN